jgi:2,3-bisphosphoglycerate-dependent phosphoglycerate mutase
MRLILARHGKAAHNAVYERYVHGDRHVFYDKPDLEAPLVDIGMWQARAAGKYLRDHGIVPEVVYLSPAVRAQQTWAEYGLPDIMTVVESRLREQAGGVFDWLPLSATQEQRQAYTREAKQSLDARPPAGESIREHLARVQEWLRETMARHSGATILAITHYGTIGLLGMLCEALRPEVSLAHRPDYLTPGYGSLLGYRWREGNWERDFLFRNPLSGINGET